MVRTPNKLTRAAIFASTALVAPACWSGNPPAPQHVEAGSDAPIDPKTGTVVLVVVSNGGAPISGREVRLGIGNEAPREASTDERGVATFSNLPPGNYAYETHDGHPRHSPERGMITVAAGQVARTTVRVYIAPYNPHATPMPYGAPPARRRMV